MNRHTWFLTENLRFQISVISVQLLHLFDFVIMTLFASVGFVRTDCELNCECISYLYSVEGLRKFALTSHTNSFSLGSSFSTSYWNWIMGQSEENHAKKSLTVGGLLGFFCSIFVWDKRANDFCLWFLTYKIWPHWKISSAKSIVGALFYVKIQWKIVIEGIALNSPIASRGLRYHGALVLAQSHCWNDRLCWISKLIDVIFVPLFLTFVQAIFRAILIVASADSTTPTFFESLVVAGSKILPDTWGLWSMTFDTKTQSLSVILRMEKYGCRNTLSMTTFEVFTAEVFETG